MFICPHLRLKKENVLTADDKGWTQIHADDEKRDIKNSDANRFEITLAFAIRNFLLSVIASHLKSRSIVGRKIQPTVNHRWCNRNPSNSSALICVYLPSSAVKKRECKPQMTRDGRRFTQMSRIEIEIIPMLTHLR